MTGENIWFFDIWILAIFFSGALALLVIDLYTKLVHKQKGIKTYLASPFLATHILEHMNCTLRNSC